MSVDTEHGESLADFYVEKQPWVKDAACVGSAPDVFFERGWTNEALSICAVCPVRKQCAEQALLEEGNAPYGRFGVRGFMTPEQRDVVFRRGGLQGFDPKNIVAGRIGQRRVAPIPKDGIPWSRHHTTLACKVYKLVTERYAEGQKLPTTEEMSALIGVNVVPLAHVLQELCAIGVLEGTGTRYRYAGPALHSTLPRAAARGTTAD